MFPHAFPNLKYRNGLFRSQNLTSYRESSLKMHISTDDITLDILFANSFYKLHFEANNISVVECGSCSWTVRKSIRNTIYLETVLYSCTQTFQRLHSKQNTSQEALQALQGLAAKAFQEEWSSHILSIQSLIKCSAQTRTKTSLYFLRSSTRLSSV